MIRALFAGPLGMRRYQPRIGAAHPSVVATDTAAGMRGQEGLATVFMDGFAQRLAIPPAPGARRRPAARQRPYSCAARRHAPAVDDGSCAAGRDTTEPDAAGGR